MEYSFSRMFSFQPELLLSLNTSKVDKKLTSSDIKIDVYQIQVPLNIKFKIGNDKVKFFATAGPYINYGISAKGKKEKTYNLYDDKTLNRFDIGLGESVGIEVSNFMFSIGYQLGLADLLKDATDGSSVRFNAFQISVGYLF